MVIKNIIVTQENNRCEFFENAIFSSWSLLSRSFLLVVFDVERETEEEKEQWSDSNEDDDNGQNNEIRLWTERNKKTRKTE